VTAAIFILPQGPTIGGVTSWACAAANALVRAGHAATVFVHGGLPDHANVRLPLDSGVHLVSQPDLPTPSSLAGNIEPIIERYEELVRSHFDGHPVVVIPTRDADCFVACASLVHRQRDLVRMLGWRHSPMPYEREIFAHVGSFMSRMVAVSDQLADELRRHFPSRAGEIARVHNAVSIPRSHAVRAPLGTRPLRLIYTGRLDEPIKRVEALVRMSLALDRAGVSHELDIVGDGPALCRLATMAQEMPALTLHGPLEPERIGPLLDRADIFVLPSRMEGLSLAALEAMAHGCALVHAETPSGARDLVGDGECGLIAAAPPHASAEQAGAALAEAVRALLSDRVDDIGRRARARAVRLFSLEEFTRAVAQQIQLTTQAPAPTLRAEPLPFHDARRPASVPPDARARMQRALEAIASRRVIIFGCGAHTRALIEVILGSDAHVVALSDDDPSVHGSVLSGLPIVAPDQLASTGATDVIISSWMHEDAIFARRELFERQGLRVHRLYATPLMQPA